MRKINKIIIHCSDSPDDRAIGFAEINQWHKDRNFFAYEVNRKIYYCGYHFIVRKSGVIEVARPIEIVGCHVKGHNDDSIGICWEGRKELTPAQRDSLALLTHNLCVDLKLGVMNIFGHCEFSAYKTCPNFQYPETFNSMKEFRTLIRDMLGA